MIGPVLDIPEETLRSLPDTLPGTPPVDITASDALRPGATQATSSTFKFQCCEQVVILQTFPRLPSANTPHLLGGLLHDQQSKSLAEQVTRFLLDSGSKLLGNGSETLNQFTRMTRLSSSYTDRAKIWLPAIIGIAAYAWARVVTIHMIFLPAALSIPLSLIFATAAGYWVRKFFSSYYLEEVYETPEGLLIRHQGEEQVLSWQDISHFSSTYYSPAGILIHLKPQAYDPSLRISPKGSIRKTCKHLNQLLEQKKS